MTFISSSQVVNSSNLECTVFSTNMYVTFTCGMEIGPKQNLYHIPIGYYTRFNLMSTLSSSTLIEGRVVVYLSPQINLNLLTKPHQESVMYNVVQLIFFSSMVNDKYYLAELILFPH